MATIEQMQGTVKVSEFIEAFDFEVYDIPKTIDWMVTLRPLVGLSIGLYLFAIYFGQNWMKNRPAYKLDRALFFWNLGLSIFSIIATLRATPEVIWCLTKPDGLYLITCVGEHHNYATAFWALMFVISKFVEFGDTAFIVLRKQKLIVLHWFHHVATLVVVWIAFEHYDPLGRFFILNTIVHSIMYPYYALRVLKFKIPRKLSMALTSLQILQMLIGLYIISYTLQKMREGLACQRHENVTYAVGFAASSFAILFLNFFIQTYLKPKKKAKGQ